MKKGDCVIYLGETILPRHDIHRRYKSLLTKGKMYKLDSDLIKFDDYYFINVIDDRNMVGGYEIKTSYICNINDYRDSKINSLIND